MEIVLLRSCHLRGRDRETTLQTWLTSCPGRDSKVERHQSDGGLRSNSDVNVLLLDIWHFQDLALVGPCNGGTRQHADDDDGGYEIPQIRQR